MFHSWPPAWRYISSTLLAVAFAFVCAAAVSLGFTSADALFFVRGMFVFSNLNLVQRFGLGRMLPHSIPFFSVLQHFVK